MAEGELEQRMVALEVELAADVFPAGEAVGQVVPSAARPTQRKANGTKWHHRCRFR